MLLPCFLPIYKPSFVPCNFFLFILSVPDPLRFVNQFTLDAGLLARSQYSEGPAIGHLDTGFSWFPRVFNR
jgi:hypothetical protein